MIYLESARTIKIMWQRILEYFADSPSQQKVIRFLLENGFGISPNGKTAVNGVEISAAAVARAVNVDRRVIETVIQRILEIDELKNLFTNLRVTPDFTNVAKELGLSVVTIFPKNAEDKNIVASVAGVLAAFNLPLRQIFVTDSYTAENPKLVIIVDGKLPSGALDKLRELPAIKAITF